MNNKKSDTSYTQSALFFQIKQVFPDNVVCAFSTRAYNYDYRDADELMSMPESKISRARKILFEQLGLKYEDAVFLEQVHKSNVAFVSSKDKGRGVWAFEESISQTDAALTDSPGIALCILTADCLPLVFFEPKGQYLGIAHAGWRGIKEGIIQHTVDKMCASFPVSAQDIKVCIGPAIGKCCYEVGREFLELFPEDTYCRQDSVYFDLKGAAMRQLTGVGIVQVNITDARLCTKCNNDKFFSYRAGDNLKRMLTVVAIKQNKGQRI